MMKGYYKPTPVFWRKVGDTLLIVSTSITAYGIAHHQEAIAMIACISGTLGKCITNLFNE